jgi:hypothetical protein
MDWLGGRIGNAARRLSAAFDQSRCNTTARQLGGEDRARRSPSDNCDRNLPVRFRSQAKPPGSRRPLSYGSYDRASC